MNIRFYNIKWDTDNSGTDLPEEITLTSDTFKDDEDVSLYGADLLSDTYGFCVINFSYEII